MKESFILYTEQKAVIDKLTDEQAGQLIKAIYKYAETEEAPKLDMLIDLVFTPIKQSIDRNSEKWEERYKILAFYIEHDELEKVEIELTGLSADISVEEYKHCIAELDTTMFILEHIQEKEEFHLRSIF
jgi:hypothetical protein